MPNFGYEAHDGGFEGVVGGDEDVDFVVAVFVRCVGGSSEMALKVCEVFEVLVVGGCSKADAGGCVVEDIVDLLLESAVAVGCHIEGFGRKGWQ